VVLLVDQVVSGSDVVVTVGLHASDGVFLFELVVLDEFGEQTLFLGHLLESREKTRISGDRINALQIILHERVVADVLNFESFFWVSVQNLCYEIFAL
jgi:hypothetical protein